MTKKINSPDIHHWREYNSHHITVCGLDAYEKEITLAGIPSSVDCYQCCAIMAARGAQERTEWQKRLREARRVRATW